MERLMCFRNGNYIIMLHNNPELIDCIIIGQKGVFEHMQNSQIQIYPAHAQGLIRVVD